MADDVTQPATEPEPTAGPPAEAQNTDTSPAEVMIPKSRFDEVNNALKELRDRQTKAETEAEKARKAELEKREEFKALYETTQAELESMRPYKAQYDALKEATAGRNQERIKAVPEAMKTLIPDYEDPFKLSAWLDANETVFSKPRPPVLDGGAGGGSRNGTGQTLTDAEINEMAAVYGVSPQHLKAQLTRS